MTSTAPPARIAPPASRSVRPAALALAGVASAFLATGCCVGPLLLAALGLGGAGVIVRLEPYRPYLAAVTVALLIAAVVAAHRGRAASDGCGCAAERFPVVRTGGRLIVWLGFAVAAALLAVPYIMELL